LVIKGGKQEIQPYITLCLPVTSSFSGKTYFSIFGLETHNESKHAQYKLHSTEIFHVMSITCIDKGTSE
jgi:hypothetical protein